MDKCGTNNTNTTNSNHSGLPKPVFLNNNSDKDTKPVLNNDSEPVFVENSSNSKDNKRQSRKMRSLSTAMIGGGIGQQQHRRKSAVAIHQKTAVAVEEDEAAFSEPDKEESRRRIGN